MADNIGWVSIYRQIQDHWIWKDPVKLKWWLDILLTVNNTDAKVNIGLEIHDCKRGESLMSLQSWGTRWGVSKDAARNFLKLLEKDKMIRCVSIGKSTRITVCNYDSYQNGLHVRKTTGKRSANDRQTQSHPNNNDNNDNNIINVEFSVFWDAYGKKVGLIEKVEKKWNSLKDEERLLAMKHIPKYIESQPDKKYRKDPMTYLNNKSWNDEIITDTFKQPQNSLFIAAQVGAQPVNHDDRP